MFYRRPMFGASLIAFAIVEASRVFSDGAASGQTLQQLSRGRFRSRSAPGHGPVRIGPDSSLRKRMRALRRGVA